MLTIKELRTLTGMGQTRFAKEYCINLSTLQRWEAGMRKPPRHYLYALNQLLKYEGYFYDKAK